MSIKVSVTQVTSDGFDPTVHQYEDGSRLVIAGGVTLPIMTPSQWVAFCSVVDKCRMWGAK